MDSDSTQFPQYHLHQARPEKLQFALYDLTTYREQNQCKADVPHSHSYFQLIWFKTGNGTHEIDFQSFPIQPDTFFFVAKDQIHAFDEHLDITGWLIHFNEHFFTQSDADLLLKHQIFSLDLSPSVALTPELIAVAQHYFTLIQAELNNHQHAGHKEVIRLLIKSLLITLTRARNKKELNASKHNRNYHLKFVQFQQLIESHFKQGLSIEAYAGLLNVSPKTLTSISKTIVQKTPSNVLAERVILEAKRLLKFSPLQISEIAYQLGFEDASYFVKYFKRHVNLAPSNFRDQVTF